MISAKELRETQKQDLAMLMRRLARELRCAARDPDAHYIRFTLPQNTDDGTQKAFVQECQKLGYGCSIFCNDLGGLKYTVRW